MPVAGADQTLKLQQHGVGNEARNRYSSDLANAPDVAIWNVQYAEGTRLAILNKIYIMPKPGKPFMVPARHHKLMLRTHGYQVRGRPMLTDIAPPPNYQHIDPDEVEPAEVETTNGKQVFAVPKGYKLVPVNDAAEEPDAQVEANEILTSLNEVEAELE